MHFNGNQLLRNVSAFKLWAPLHHTALSSPTAPTTTATAAAVAAIAVAVLCLDEQMN